MIGRLALRNFTFRPWRSALLFVGFGLGVAVMIVLLSIGEAMVTQAQDERLVGGGDITVLPEGIDIEVMKTGGLGGLFFSIPNARFVYLQLLASPRLAGTIRAVAPQSTDKLLYLTTADGVERTVRGSGRFPRRPRRWVHPPRSSPARGRMTMQIGGGRIPPPPSWKPTLTTFTDPHQALPIPGVGRNGTTSTLCPLIDAIGCSSRSCWAATCGTVSGVAKSS